MNKKLEPNTPEYWDAKYIEYLGKGLNRVDLPGFDMMVGKIKPNDRVLDFGCGCGEWLRHISQAVPEAKLYGSDISIIAMRESLKNVPDLAWYDDVSIFNDYFDVVTCLHTIEHFKEPVECIKLLKQVLKPDGLLIVVIPWKDQVWQEHYKIWGKAEVEELFNHFDCDVKSIVRYPTNLNRDNKIIFKEYQNGTLFREVICFVRFN